MLIDLRFVDAKASRGYQANSNTRTAGREKVGRDRWPLTAVLAGIGLAFAVSLTTPWPVLQKPGCQETGV